MNEQESEPEPANTEAPPPALGLESTAIEESPATETEAPPAAPTATESDAPVESPPGESPETEPKHGERPQGERPPKGERRRKRGSGHGPGGPGGPGDRDDRGGHGRHGGPSPHAGHPDRAHRYVEDRIDADAEQLAREAKSLPASRVRPLAALTAQVRRLLTSQDPHDRREARRALVLFKSKVAFLAGREIGRERNAFVKVRDLVSRGVDQLVRERELLDPQQARNFLDLVDAFVGYHRFHGDDRRRD